MDPSIAMSIVERREEKWGGLDCLEMALSGSCLAFVSTPASQGTIDLTWRRGMSKAPFYGVMLANVMPLLIYFSSVLRYDDRSLPATRATHKHLMLNKCARYYM